MSLMFQRFYHALIVLLFIIKPQTAELFFSDGLDDGTDWVQDTDWGATNTGSYQFGYSGSECTTGTCAYIQGDDTWLKTNLTKTGYTALRIQIGIDLFNSSPSFASKVLL